jgi:hypothetical protein
MAHSAGRSRLSCQSRLCSIALADTRPRSSRAQPSPPNPHTPGERTRCSSTRADRHGREVDGRRPRWGASSPPRRRRRSASSPCARPRTPPAPSRSWTASSCTAATSATTPPPSPHPNSWSTAARLDDCWGGGGGGRDRGDRGGWGGGRGVTATATTVAVATAARRRIQLAMQGGARSRRRRAHGTLTARTCRWPRGRRRERLCCRAGTRAVGRPPEVEWRRWSTAWRSPCSRRAIVAGIGRGAVKRDRRGRASRSIDASAREGDGDPIISRGELLPSRYAYLKKLPESVS